MSKHPPYFPFYPDDWLESDAVCDMGYECNGVYLKLLCLMWKKGGFIPDRGDWCCRALWLKPAKWKKIRGILVSDFGVIQVENERLFNERISEELRVFNEKSQKSVEKANKRWNKVRQNNHEKVNKINETSNATAMQQQCYTDTDLDKDLEKSKELKRKSTKKKFSLPENIDQKLWDEWMQVRFKKKAVNSETALNALLKKLSLCAESGTTENEAMIIAIENSWKSVQPDWIDNLKTNGQSKPNQERQKFVRKPSKDFIQQHPELDESVLAGEFTRLKV